MGMLKMGITFKGTKAILPTCNYDRGDRTAAEKDSCHSLNTEKNGDLRKEFNAHDIKSVGMKKADGGIGTRSELFQNIGNSILILQEAHKKRNGEYSFSAKETLSKLSRDFLNGDINTKECRKWLDYEKCDLPADVRRMVKNILDDCRTQFNPSDDVERHMVNGLGRLMQTEMSKLHLKKDTNGEMENISKKMMAMLPPSHNQLLVNKWLNNPPEEYPIGRTQSFFQQMGRENTKKMIMGEKKEFDAPLFMAFQRAQLIMLDNDFKNSPYSWQQRAHAIKDGAREINGDQRGKFQKLDDVRNQSARTEQNYGVGITRRKVSQDENDFYTDSHIKPTDWKRPDVTRKVHADALLNGRALATGVSNTANIHISGMYQLGVSSVMLRYGEPLNKKEMRRYTEMVINTMCLDGGHSRWEVLKGVNNLWHLMDNNMDDYYRRYGGPENNSVKKFDQDFIKNLKEIAPDALVKGGLEYDLHYKKMREDKTIDPADQINAFANALTQLRNGGDAKKHDLMQLRVRNTVPSNPSIHKFSADKQPAPRQAVLVRPHVAAQQLPPPPPPRLQPPPPQPKQPRSFRDMSRRDIEKLTVSDLNHRRTKTFAEIRPEHKKYLRPEVLSRINSRIDEHNKKNGFGFFSKDRMRHL
jgi:hypothetical protein